MPYAAPQSVSVHEPDEMEADGKADDEPPRAEDADEVECLRLRSPPLLA